MIKDKEIAGHISDRALEVGRLLDEMLRFVEGKCPEEEFFLLRRAIGQVLGELLFEVLNPLYKQHPDLQPEEMKAK